MRKQLVATLNELFRRDERLVLLLGGIGAFAFRDLFAEFPKRCYDLEINEQAIIGTAAGLAKSGFVPIVYGIAPFFVERCYEQIKLDIGYQGMKAIVISVGASYDYSQEGCTHHCPADVNIMAQIPGMNILVPGTPSELEMLLENALLDSYPYYIRLSAEKNSSSHLLFIGELTRVQNGRDDAYIVAVGPTLDKVLTVNNDYSVCYSNSVKPFDWEMLTRLTNLQTLVFVEPYYSYLAGQAHIHFDRPIQIKSVAVKHEFIEEYGDLNRLNELAGITSADVERILA